MSTLVLSFVLGSACVEKGEGKWLTLLRWNFRGRE